MRYRVHSTSMMAESYADGSFFLRRLASARDAFAWPATREWLTERDRRQVMKHIALQATIFLPALRGVRTRSSLLRAFGQILREVPTVVLHPVSWIRVAYGLLPWNVINSLRLRKRRMWVRQHSGAMLRP
jgi:hypothetical protein